MPYQFSNEEYADIVFVYGFCNGNAEQAQYEYRERFPNRRIPNTKTFTSVFRCLRTNGSFPSHSYSLERPQRHQVNVEENVIRQIQRSPCTSTRRISFRTGLTQSKVWRILKKEKLYPFHYQKVQNLLPRDLQIRLQFCHWLEDNYDKVNFILFSDEATFTRNGIFNSRNSHLWSVENPYCTTETSFQHRFHVNIWCGIICNKLVGPFIFNENLTGAVYLNFLQNNLPLLLEEVPLLTRRELIFQQDGSPPHSSLAVKNHLNETFNNWIGRGGPINWPPRSPDLTPLDYYLWGRMKALVYEEKVNTREELLVRINNAAELIRNKPDEIQNAIEAILIRTQCCINSDGGHFEQFL